MKNLFNSLIVLFLALSYTMAELVPNCSHVLQFSDEEVECLQKLLFLKPIHSYESFFEAKIDPNTLKKYPPHNLKQSIQGFASYEIQNKETIFKFINNFSDIFENFTTLGNFHSYFIYVILVVMFEKLEFPFYYPMLLNEPYNIVALGIHRILQCWPERFQNPKAFPEFRKNRKFSIPNSVETDSIFIPVKIYKNNKINCCLQ